MADLSRTVPVSSSRHKKTTSANSSFTYYIGSLSNLTDACQEILHMFSAFFEANDVLL